MKTKENRMKKFFYKNNPRGISLIVLVITIIVIIILSTAIIVSLVNNNPISEANKARYQSDRDNMQSIFTNTVAKVMAEKQETISIEAGRLNTVTSGEKSVAGDAIYKLSDGVTTGKITFDSETNKENQYYTGEKLPIYSKETIWDVDEEGILRLQVGEEIYGEESKEKDNIMESGKAKMVYLGSFYSYISNTIDVSEYEGYKNFTVDNFVLSNVCMKAVRNTRVDDKLFSLLNSSSYNPDTGKLTTTIVGDSTGDWMVYLIFDLYLIVGNVEKDQ